MHVASVSASSRQGMRMVSSHEAPARCCAPVVSASTAMISPRVGSWRRGAPPCGRAGARRASDAVGTIAACARTDRSAAATGRDDPSWRSVFRLMRRLMHRVPQSLWWSLLAWLPMLLWLAAFFPGLMSADSLAIWQQATEGGWRDVHPPIYTAAMWVSAHTVDSPVLLTLAQSWFLAFAIVSVALACIRAGANRRLVIVVTAILVCTPMVGAFAVT